MTDHLQRDSNSRSPRRNGGNNANGEKKNDDGSLNGLMSALSGVAAPDFFEGTEKRIEVDFVGAGDLTKVPYAEWEEVVTRAETKILHQKVSEHFTSFLLSESSLIVYPGKVILKTCGGTVPLKSIDKLFAIARSVKMEPEWLCYSRKNFLAPSRQPEEYQSKESEIQLCQNACSMGSAYVLGPLNGEHWLLYDADFKSPDCSKRGDYTVDMMMYGLPASVQQLFFTSEPEGSVEGAAKMTRACGLADLASSIGAEVDDYCFDKCGYSCNAHAGNAYFMVHVTPQDGFSYASFETNYGASFHDRPGESRCDALNELVRKVLESFQPEKLTMTLFVDAGALDSIGGAPFAATKQQYKRKSLNSYHFETDYVATVADYVRLAPQ